MNLHEFQSKALMRTLGLPVLQGFVCHNADEVEVAAKRLGVGPCVIKAQVHAGGRGKAGGIRLAKTPEEARILGETILGMVLTTKQTGAEGKVVHKVYVEEACLIDREFYLSFLIDRSRQALCVVASTEGGMDIEEVARNKPEKIHKIILEQGTELGQGVCLELAQRLMLDEKLSNEFEKLLSKLHKMFFQYDLSLIEINPLVLTKNNKLIVLDAKCTVDDNALFRQPEIKAFLDEDEIDPKELAANKFGLNYIALDGHIGCMVNGAGLAMATMDLVKLFGGSPANFLDVGGGASAEGICAGFRILLSDPNVRVVLVNIFGGILRCDVLAQGIVDAATKMELKVPLIVRLQGTNVEAGRRILEDSGLKIFSADTMAEAAKNAVEAEASGCLGVS